MQLGVLDNPEVALDCSPAWEEEYAALAVKDLAPGPKAIPKKNK
jgi:hypothetical protein